MSELHEVVFRWPYNANEVIVTGTFDHWARSIRMEKGPSGFAATVRVPWEQKVLYKFVVDGKWATIDKAPTEADWRGNINNVYNAPTRPKVDTPRYEPPAVQEPKITPVPAPVPVKEKKGIPTPAPQPTKQASVEVPAKPEGCVKDQTPVVDKKEPSPPVDKKVTPSVPKVAPAPVIPVKETKPVDTPPAKTDAPGNVPAVLPTPANLKAPLAIVPVNDASTVDKRPPAIQPSKSTDTPSTHTPPVNSPRKASTGTSSSNTLLSEKKEEEKKEAKPEEVKHLNGTTSGIVKQPEPTPAKDKIPTTLSPTPATPPTYSSPPTTPKKSHFPGSTPSSPPSSPGNTLSRKSSFKKKRDSFITKLKHLFTHEKDKEEHEHGHKHEHGHEHGHKHEHGHEHGHKHEHKHKHKREKSHG